jgi:murein L,D-transpeptidase YafK
MVPDRNPERVEGWSTRAMSVRVDSASTRSALRFWEAGRTLFRSFFALALLAGCTPASAQQMLDTDVDLVVVDKAQHRLSVYREGVLLKSYVVALGWGGLGPKTQQGDGKVPEGRYRIAAHNPNSAYHLSLRIGYPTPAQRTDAVARGVSPGGDIMIHGLPNGRGGFGATHRTVDWTDGCIAVTDEEIEELFDHVADGTPIVIQP